MRYAGIFIVRCAASLCTHHAGSNRLVRGTGLSEESAVSRDLEALQHIAARTGLWFLAFRYADTIYVHDITMTILLLQLQATVRQYADTPPVSILRLKELIQKGDCPGVSFLFHDLGIFVFDRCPIVSYLTEKPSYEKIVGLTYGTVTAEHKKETRASWTTTDLVTSGIVLALIIAAYLYFTG